MDMPEGLRNTIALIEQVKKRIKPSIMVGLPIIGGVADSDFWFSLDRFLQAYSLSGVPVMSIPLVQESLVTRARNRLTAHFLAGDCTHLMFIDSDIMFHVDSISRLLLHDLPITVGAYPMKQLPIKYVVNATGGVGGTAPVKETPIGRVVEVREAGTGFMLIKREVFEGIVAQGKVPPVAGSNGGGLFNFPPEYVERLEQHYHGFFHDPFVDHPTKDRKRHLSEDYNFCRLAAECGYKTFLDPAIKLNHIGRFVYEGDISTLFEAAGVVPEGMERG